MHYRHLLLHAYLEAAATAAGDKKGGAGPLVAGKLYNEHPVGFMPENIICLKSMISRATTLTTTLKRKTSSTTKATSSYTFRPKPSAKPLNSV